MTSFPRRETVISVGGAWSGLRRSSSGISNSLPGGTVKAVAPLAGRIDSEGSNLPSAGVPPSLIRIKDALTTVRGLNSPKSGVATMRSAAGMAGAVNSRNSAWPSHSKLTPNGGTYSLRSGGMRRMTSVLSPGPRAKSATASTGLSGGRPTDTVSGRLDWFSTVTMLVRDWSGAGENVVFFTLITNGGTAWPLAMSRVGSLARGCRRSTNSPTRCGSKRRGMWVFSPRRSTKPPSSSRANGSFGLRNPVRTPPPTLANSTTRRTGGSPNATGPKSSHSGVTDSTGAASRMLMMTRPRPVSLVVPALTSKAKASVRESSSLPWV